MVGWLLDIRMFKSIHPDGSPMMFNTALGFILSGAALAFLLQSRSQEKKRLAAIPAALILLIGLATAAEYALGLDLGIDQALWRAGDGAPFPGRMSPMTAAGFIVAGLSLLTAAFGRSAWVQTGGLLVLLFSLVPLAGYAYEVSALYGSERYTGMAMNTAVSFALLGFTLLNLCPERTLLRILLSDSAGGMTARRLLLVIPPAIFVLGWICVQLARSDRFDDVVTPLALLAVLSIFCSITVLGWHSMVLHKVDLERRRGLEEIRSLNEELERKVEERTAELRLALDHVRKLEGLLPVCAWCRKVRDDGRGRWETLEEYLSSHTDAQVTHSICPECFRSAMTAA
jgi:hypothetical protein